MDAVAIKERLHQYIERADSKHLEAIYVLVEKELEPSYEYTAATLEMLYQRRDSHLNGQSLSYTLEDVMKSVRNTNK
jgi:hypothetical protein